MMSTEKLLSKKLKKTITTTLPIVALSGLISTAAMVQVATANDEATAADPAQEITIDPSQDITAEQREAWIAQLLGQGKTQEEAEAVIDEMLKQRGLEK